MIKNHSYQYPVRSTTYISSLYNINFIIKNPVQFLLFFFEKNKTLKLVSSKDSRQIIEFLGFCLNSENLNQIKILENKIFDIFKQNTNISNLAADTLIHIIQDIEFDACLYPQRLVDIVKDWYAINAELLKKYNIQESDINYLSAYIGLYKLSEAFKI